MKQIVSNQMGDGHNVKKSEYPLNLIQAFLFEKFGRFSVKEILEGGAI